MTSWTWAWLLRNLLGSLLMPPLLWIILACMVLCFLNKKRTLQKGLLGLCIIFLWLTSTTYFANCLVMFTDSWMHWPKPVSIESIQADQFTEHRFNKNTELIHDRPIGAIVVLGGGRIKGALERPDQGFQDLSSESLQRVRMAARLAKATNLPILVTGGDSDGDAKYATPEADLMANVLTQEFHTPVKWIERQSTTTQENARYTSEILNQEAISHIYLVTHFWHMPRSQRIFAQYGMEVEPVPMVYTYMNQLEITHLNPLDFLPRPEGLGRVMEVWHEILGGIWYRIHFLKKH